METLRKLTAFFLSASFVIAAVTALLLFNFDRRAFSAETYQQAFAREDFYNDLPRLMANAIAASNTDTSQLPLMMQGMGVEAWEGFIRTLLPPEVLRSMGDNVLTSTFAYLNLQTNAVLVDLTPVKAGMSSERGTQAVLGLFNTLPACTLEQVARITFNLLAGAQLEFCNPPAELLPVFTPVIQGQMQFTAAMIPDQFTLVTAPPQNDPRVRLMDIRFLMRFSLFLPIGLLFTLTVLAVRSWKDLLLWWGAPFTVTGAGTALVGLLGAPVFGVVLEQVLIRQLPAYLPAFLANFTSDLAAAIVQALLTPVLWQGLVLFVLGAGMAGLGALIKE